MKMKTLLSLILLLFTVTATSLNAQNKNSIQGDYEALMALYNSTQGYGIETLSSKSNLPSPSNASYPYMYIINNEIWALSKERRRGIGEWVNHGAIWKDKTGWTDMTPSTMGNAVGVEVDSNGRVITLDMQKVTTTPRGSGTITAGNGLIGVLPPEIGNLKKMQWINLKQNFFHGSIPDVFTGWNDLERWSIGGQTWELNLDRRIEWHESSHVRVSTDDNPFTHFTVAKEILSTNNFTGPLPMSLDGLSSLELIEAAHQYLEGPLPSWSDMPSIRGIYMPNIRGPENKTLGSVPDSWGNFITMQLFSLNNYNTYSRFSGQLPEEMKDWENLANFTVSSNDFSGEFPQFTGFTDLVYLTIGGNNFDGEFPWTSIFNGNNSRLSKFGLARNNFSGELPQTIPDATYPVGPDSPNYRPRYNLSAFGIQNNNFSGDLPEWVANFHGLQIINISVNDFTGPFPESLLAQSNLKTVYLQNNNLSGPLPDAEWPTNRIRWFQINNNNFEGEIPDSWQTLFQNADGSWNDGTFQRYLFHNNNFSGQIPDWGKHVNWGNFQMYTFDGNRYTFKDVGDVYDDLKKVFGSNFDISNQKSFGRPQSRTMPAGEEVIFDLSAFHYDGNKYRWLKNGDPISGATSPVLELSSLSSADEGEYRLEVTNSRMPELGTHISRPITFQLGDNDGKNEGDKDGGESEPEAPGTPELKTPENNAAGLPLHESLQWSSNGADYYRLQVRNGNDSVTIIDEEIESNPYRLDGWAEEGETYRWRVQAVKDDMVSEWSPEWSFTTALAQNEERSFPDAPELNGPEDRGEQVSLTPEFSWSDIRADYYILHVSRTSPGGMVVDVTVTDTAYTPSDILGQNSTHHWRVRGVKEGELGEWSKVQSFTTQDGKLPEMADLVYPDNRAQNMELNFTYEWDPTDADLYHFRLRERDSQKWAIEKSTEKNYYTPNGLLTEETAYIWQVKTIKDGVEGAWGPMWEFTTGEYEVIVEIPGLIAPGNQKEYDNLRPEFEWEDVGADKYVIAIYRAEQVSSKNRPGEMGEDAESVAEIDGTHYTPDEPLEAKTVYKWRVRAVKDGAEGEWSELWEFKTTTGKTVASEPREKPISTELHQNYPNPFNPTTQIEFTLANVEKVSLRVYDLAGREVARLADEVRQVGRHVVTFNAENLASGVYFYRFITETQQFTKKMTLVK